MKRNDDSPESLLPDVLRNGNGSEALHRLLADVSPDEVMPRKVEFGNKDPFHLLEIQDTYEHMAEDLFVACEGITKVCAEANKETKKAYLKSDSLTLPVVEVSKRHCYQLRRRVDGESVIYTYQRQGKGHEQAGFQVIQNSVGHTILKTLNPEDTPVDDDEEYLKLITMARRFINEYATGINIPLASLEVYAKREIVQEKVVRKIGRGVLHSAGVVGGSLRKGLRPLPYVFAAALVLAPIPGYSTALYEGSPLLKPTLMELGDDMFNSDDHKRQGYDAKGFHVPDSAQLINNGETSLLNASPLIPLLAVEFEDAPKLDANSPSEQDLYGGPRLLTNLGLMGEDEMRNNDLDPTECEDVIVNIDPEDGVRVTGIDPSIDKKLEMTVAKKRIKICNVSDGTIHMDKMQTIHIEVHDRTLKR